MNRTEEIWNIVEANYKPLQWRLREDAPQKSYIAELPFQIGGRWGVTLTYDIKDESFYYHTFAEAFDGTPEIKRVHTASFQEAAAQVEKEYIDLICRFFGGYDG